MQYGTFRNKGYFIGSGVIEAGCKTVVGSRCKQSGMFWTVRGAENILAFRCIHASRRLDAFWKHRLNQQAARKMPWHYQLSRRICHAPPRSSQSQINSPALLPGRKLHA